MEKGESSVLVSIVCLVARTFDFWVLAFGSGARYRGATLGSIGMSWSHLRPIAPTLAPVCCHATARYHLRLFNYR